MSIVKEIFKDVVLLMIGSSIGIITMCIMQAGARADRIMKNSKEGEKDSHE